MEQDRFSRRHGYWLRDEEIRVRDDAPTEVRQGILAIAESELELRPSMLRDSLCSVLRRLPDPSNWSEYPNVWRECQNLIMSAPWYRVYDFVEDLYARLNRSRDPGLAKRWAELINEFFAENGVGWHIQEGTLESRGEEGFQEAIDTARTALSNDGHQTARGELHEAVRDLSRRPSADLTGAIQHAMAALECVAREVTGDRNATLGQILKKFDRLLPPPLDIAVAKLWGFTSEVGRHLREDQTPERPEAELVVLIAAAVCSYLVAKKDI